MNPPPPLNIPPWFPISVDSHASRSQPIAWFGRSPENLTESGEFDGVRRIRQSPENLTESGEFDGLHTQHSLTESAGQNRAFPRPRERGNASPRTYSSSNQPPSSRYTQGAGKHLPKSPEHLELAASASIQPCFPIKKFIQPCFLIKKVYTAMLSY